MSVQLNPEGIKYIQQNFTNSLKFRLALFNMLPMGFLSGMKVSELSHEKCVVSVPYKRLNKNPFKSTFWAVLGMAAEMASGAMLVMYTHKQKPSVAMLVVKCEGQFFKKATGITYFTCESGEMIKLAILKTLETGEAVEITCPTSGRDEKDELVAEFNFVWSVKRRG
jgi:acyl-coenzyme A thioesterase PaaI-like protein